MNSSGQSPARLKFHKAFLERVIDLACTKATETEAGPFAALIVHNGNVIGEGWNQVTASGDPTAHAEIVAIRAAAHHLSNFSLAGCTLYASCEPCPMCLGAVMWARLDAVYYAASRSDAAGAGFDDAHFYRQLELPPEQRAMPLIQLAVPGAQTPFEAWNANAKRKPY